MDFGAVVGVSGVWLKILDFELSDASDDSSATFVAAVGFGTAFDFFFAGFFGVLGVFSLVFFFDFDFDFKGDLLLLLPLLQLLFLLRHWECRHQRHSRCLCRPCR